MLFKGTIIGPASGKLAGIVASHNRTGQYFRQLRIPVNPMSAAQIAVRGAVAAAVQNWMVLSSTMRTRWGNWAANVPRVNALGDTHYITGQQAFVGAEVLRDQAGLTYSNSIYPAVYNRGASGVTFAEATDLDEGAIEYTAAVATWELAGGALLIYETAPYSGTREFRVGGFTLTDVVLGNAVAPTSPQSFTFVKPFNAVGEKKTIRVVALSVDHRYTGGEEFEIVMT